MEDQGIDRESGPIVGRQTTFAAAAILAVLLILSAPALIATFRALKGFPGGSDFRAPLANGYFIHRNNAVDIEVSPDARTSGTPYIPATVIELDHDLTWVIAKQHDRYGESDPRIVSYWILNTAAPKV